MFDGIHTSAAEETSRGKHIFLIRCVLVFNVHVNVTSSQLCWCSKDQINILPWAQCAFPEEMAGRGLDWGLRTSHPLSVMVSFPPAPLAGSPPWGRAVRSFSLAHSLARSSTCSFANCHAYWNAGRSLLFSVLGNTNGQ